MAHVKRSLWQTEPSSSQQSPHLGWVILLDSTGLIQSVQAQPWINQQLRARAKHYLGHSLKEWVTFADPNAFQTVMATLQTSPQPQQLLGQLALERSSVDIQWVFQQLVAPNGQMLNITAAGYLLQPQEHCGLHQADNFAANDAFLASEAIVAGAQAASSDYPVDCGQLQTYAPKLNQITRNIRRTLDLTTIRKQAVNGLGELFDVERCVVCSYGDNDQTAIIEAEYRRETDAPNWQGRRIPIIETPYLHTATETTSAILSQPHIETGRSVISVATRYQDRVNGFILLFDSPHRQWTDLDVNLITDLADQVGTAIAHACLFGESHALALKLQEANANLMDKQHKFQEARRQAEEARRQAEEASRLKSEFLANTSHELRTPLNGMIGFLKLVLDGMADDPAEQEEFIREAHKSALHLLNLINDVLDIAKIEAGKMQIEMGPVSLRELLADLENFTRPQAEQKGLYFDIVLPATRDAITLNGNYQRLLQVLLNLVGNAIKFTHEGGITISAEVKSQKVEYQGNTWPGTVKISVADTGIGVSLEKQDRLFQTFSQVDGERTRQYGGTGLGLAISQKLVEAMGGVVQFISMGEGLGATVTFTALLYHEPVMISENTM
jgi:signal transduction histidine kinase